jgi:drug/metabolite transporter (DMT)-like permease
MKSPTVPANASPDRPLAGIGWMLAGIAIFSINDALGKWLVETYSVGELMLIRSAAALVVLIPFIRSAGIGAFVTAPRPVLQVVRVVLSAFEVGMFFWAVSYLPLADTTTFYLATPIYVTVLSAVLLSETVGWRRAGTVAVGFAGVVLALRPSAASFTVPALIAVGGSLFFAIQLVMTRLLRSTAQMVLISGQLVATLVFGAVSAPFGWVAPSMLDFLLLVLFGVLSVVALACVNHALKLAPASVVVPYQYTTILSAIVLGYAVFGDVPDLLMLAGAAIIIAAGLYIFRQEQSPTRQNPQGGQRRPRRLD